MATPAVQEKDVLLVVEQDISSGLTVEDFIEAKEAGSLITGTITVTRDYNLAGERPYTSEMEYEYVRIGGSGETYVLRLIVINGNASIPGFREGASLTDIYQGLDVRDIAWDGEGDLTSAEVDAEKRRAWEEAVICVYGPGGIVGTESELLPLVDRDPIPGPIGDTPQWILQPVGLANLLLDP